MKKVYVTHCIRVGNETREEEKILFKGTKTKEISEYIALKDLGEEIEKTCNEMHEEGYKVISITPIIRGDWGAGGGEHSFGYGFSVTDGVVITATLL